MFEGHTEQRNKDGVVLQCPFCGCTLLRLTTRVDIGGQLEKVLRHIDMTIECSCGASLRRMHTVFPDGSEYPDSAVTRWNELSRLKYGKPPEGDADKEASDLC